MRTLLIDGDLGLANLDVVLNLKPARTLDDVLAGDCDLQDVVLTGPKGVRVVPSASGLLQVPELGRLQRLVLLEQLESMEKEFDIVLIDTPAGLSRTVHHWILSATDVVLVSTPEPAAIADAYATIKVLASSLKYSHFRLIVNMARTEGEGLRVYERLSMICEERLGVRLEFLGIIPWDEVVRVSVRERVAFVDKYPKSKAAQQVYSIAEQLLSEIQAFSNTDSQCFSGQSLWWNLLGLEYQELAF